jgi:ribose 5-phosphate isomerase A
MDKQTQQKKLAGEYAADTFVNNDMIVGLGEGSTAIFAIRRIAQLLSDGKLSRIQAVPCSKTVENEAKRLGIPLIELGSDTKIDVTIDGADEVDPQLNLIKGGGGALTREKIVAQATTREVIVIDSSKQSAKLGMKWPVPIEVIRFGWQRQIGFLKSLEGKPRVRKKKDGEAYITDQGNYILDCDFGVIEKPAELARILNQRAGIVEHGLFIDLATDLIVAENGKVTHTKK